MGPILYPGQPLPLAGSVNSSLGLCQLQLQETGLFVLYQGQSYPVPNLTGFSLTTEAVLETTGLVVLGNPQPQSINFGFNVLALEVQNDGEVQVFSQGGGYVNLLTYVVGEATTQVA